nr:tyrosine decarboxylase 1 [Ipomoea batatas]
MYNISGFSSKYGCRLQRLANSPWTQVQITETMDGIKTLWLGEPSSVCEELKNHIELAKRFEEFVSEDSRFEVVAHRKFSLVCFRLLPPQNDEDLANKLNRDLLDAVNSSGKIFISHTVLSGKYVLRFAVGAPLTEERHVLAAWNVLQDEAAALFRNYSKMTNCFA